jgi:hypothetical protein
MTISFHVRFNLLLTGHPTIRRASDTVFRLSLACYRPRLSYPWYSEFKRSLSSAELWLNLSSPYWWISIRYAMSLIVVQLSTFRWNATLPHSDSSSLRRWRGREYCTILSSETVITGWRCLTSQKNWICVLLFSCPSFCFSFSAS